MVRGKPYISVNNATVKAANPPRERQSRDVLGCVKLKANIMNIRELMITKDQRPYAGA